MKQFEMDGSGWYTVPNTSDRRSCKFLNRNVLAFYHGDYRSNGDWQRTGTLANLIWTLKNDTHPFPNNLSNAIKQLKDILRKDLPEIQKIVNNKELTICVIPRAKTEQNYRQDQLYFKSTVSEIANELENFGDGTAHIIRIINTRTTHLDRSGDGGDGDTPYPGITNNTCIISEKVRRKDILLIDDVYTKDVGIDEDAIQALFDHGASSVIFYSIGKTLK